MSSSRLLQNKWKHTVEVSPTSHITSWQHCTWDLTYNDVLTGDLHKALFWFPSSLLASYGCCFLIQTGYISGWRFAPSGAIHNKVSRGLPIHLLWPKLAAQHTSKLLLHTNTDATKLSPIHAWTDFAMVTASVAVVCTTLWRRTPPSHQYTHTHTDSPADWHWHTTHLCKKVKKRIL